MHYITKELIKQKFMMKFTSICMRNFCISFIQKICFWKYQLNLREVGNCLFHYYEQKKTQKTNKQKTKNKKQQHKTSN